MQSVASFNMNYLCRVPHALDIRYGGGELSLFANAIVNTNLPRIVEHERVYSRLFVLAHQVELATLGTLMQHEGFDLRMHRPL